MASDTGILRLRNLAALLICLSGVGLVAMLWFRELTETAVIDALIGFSYLVIGIGLLGQSRFTLFVAIAVPVADMALVLDTTPPAALNSLQVTRLVIDGAVILCALIVLLRKRKRRAD